VNNNITTLIIIFGIFCPQGGTDSMFFIQNDWVDSYRPKLAMISLNRTDRLRLINFEPEMNQIVKNVITTFYQPTPPPMGDYHGSTEFKLEGIPFCSSGHQSIRTRQLICGLLEAMSTQGWRVKSALDISRKKTDKSIFIVEKNEGRLLFS